MQTRMDIKQVVLFDRTVTDDCPDKFPDPFHPIPHPIAVQAAKQLQTYLSSAIFKQDCSHNFLEIGKMFGILVVQHSDGEFGFLAAFSGKMDESNHIQPFVPPIFDLLEENSIFQQGEPEINLLNEKIAELQNDKQYAQLRWNVEKQESLAIERIAEFKEKFKKNKSARAQLRDSLSPLDPTSEQQLEDLRKASVNENLFLKHEKKRLNELLNKVKQELQIKEDKILYYKELRKNKSNNLQHKIFASYFLHSAQKEQRSLLEVFEGAGVDTPPAGAGECAGPKLLDFAYKNDLKPIALAEFWWGNPPPSEVRTHGNFYPSCNSKCKPILGFMLEGLKRAPSFSEELHFQDKTLTILHEDDAILVVHKPADFLSVPGKEIYDSVYTRVLTSYPAITGPIIIHRLDMATSGIMVIAKTKKAHHYLQQQFINHTIQKRYCALLAGHPAQTSGHISLPLRVDLDDRPRQLVCYTHGKEAHTTYEVIETTETATRVYFYPHTGRTHQLRMHAAHPLGLNTPIVGDDLYGTPSDRLYLHAEYIRFQHPISREIVEFYCKPDF